MRYPLVFTTLGLFLVVEAWRSAEAAHGAWWVLIAIEIGLAVSLFTLSALYGLKHAGIDVEIASESPRWGWVHFLLLPYRLIALGTLRLLRVIDREPPWSEFAPNLLIGRYPFRDEKDRIAGLGVEAILSLCFEFPMESGHEGCRHARVPILDGTPPTPEAFRKAVEWVVSRHVERKTILIHCAQGHGRSATVAVAVLVRLGFAGTVDEALTALKQSRPRARLSQSQRLALETFISASDEREPRSDAEN